MLQSGIMGSKRCYHFATRCHDSRKQGGEWMSASANTGSPSCRVFRQAILAMGLAFLLAGCVSVPSEPEPAATPTVRPDNAREQPGVKVEEPAPAVIGREEIISAGLAQAHAVLLDGGRLRPYARVYSELGGLRPVTLNDSVRQAPESDIDGLLASIRTLSSDSDLKAFAIFGLAEDREGRRWLVVHFENRQGDAQLRQYPVPPPSDGTTWQPAIMEPTKSVIF